MKKLKPKLRFPEFNDEWKEKSFKELVKLQRGSSPRPIVKYITKSNDGVNWIKISDISNDGAYIEKTNEKITKEGAKKSRFVKEGEIILSNSMTFGRPCILKIDGYIHDGWFVLREYNNNFDKEYLYQLLCSEFVQKQYAILAAGGVVNNISSELVNIVKINIPTLEEQKKIGDFLSAVDEKINHLTKKKELLEEYKKGVMKKIFNKEIRFKDDNGKDFPNWEEKSLGEVFDYKKGIGLSKEKLDINGVNSCILYGELYTKYNEVVFNVISKTNSNEGLLSKIGDLLIPTSTTTSGIDLANVTALNFDNILLGGDITVLRSSKNINNIFYAYYLSNHKKEEIAKYSQGITIIHLYYNHIKDMIIDLPCLQEQTKIADFLSSVDEKINQVTIQLEKTKEYKKGLLQKMFV